MKKKTNQTQADMNHKTITYDSFKNRNVHTDKTLYIYIYIFKRLDVFSQITRIQRMHNQSGGGGLGKERERTQVA